MTEPSVIHQERTIIRTGRWVIAFGAVCLVRMLLQLNPFSLDVMGFLLFFTNLAVGTFAILIGEGVTRKKRWALWASMILGGLLVGVSTVGTAGLVHFGLREWGRSSLDLAIVNFGPWIVIFLVVLTFWLIVLWTLMKVWVEGGRLPSRRVLWTWSLVAFAAGGGLAGRMILDHYLANRYWLLGLAS